MPREPQRVDLTVQTRAQIGQRERRRMAGDEKSARMFFGECAGLTNPLVDAERFLRSSMAPGLVRAVMTEAKFFFAQTLACAAVAAG